MAKVKYMGSADRRVFKKGEDFGGRMNTPLPHDVVLEQSNGFLADSDAEELSDVHDSFYTLLAVEPGFKDVSDLDIIPLNDSERLWQGRYDAADGRFEEGGDEHQVQYSEQFPTSLSPPSGLGEPGADEHRPENQ
jgi:hypothetical protein